MKKAQFYILIVVVLVTIMSDVILMINESKGVDFFSIYYSDLTHITANVRDTLREAVMLANDTTELEDLTLQTLSLFYRMCQEAGYTCNVTYTVYTVGINGTCIIKSRSATVAFNFNFTK